VTGARYFLGTGPLMITILKPGVWTASRDSSTTAPRLVDTTHAMGTSAGRTHSARLRLSGEDERARERGHRAEKMSGLTRVAFHPPQPRSPDSAAAIEIFSSLWGT
jgi:hypothetical protein